MSKAFFRSIKTAPTYFFFATSSKMKSETKETVLFSKQLPTEFELDKNNGHCLERVPYIPFLCFTGDGSVLFRNKMKPLNFPSIALLDPRPDKKTKNPAIPYDLTFFRINFFLPMRH